MSATAKQRNERTQKGSQITGPRHEQRWCNDAAIQELLGHVALLLLPAGVTPKHFAALAKLAFVNAAAQICRFRNGKVNQSRVAVLTGLTRSEVKRVLTDNLNRHIPASVRQTRAARVVAGWRSGKYFTDARGKPRKLALKGGRHSFASLVKQFAGDVPPKAVLSELLRLGVVRQVRGHLSLKPARSAAKEGPSNSFSELINVVADTARLAEQAEKHRVPVPIFRLPVRVRSEIEMAIVRRRAAEAIRSLFDGLSGSFQHYSRKRDSRVPKRSKGTITITALITENTEN
jgi:hypothetical protein